MVIGNPVILEQSHAHNAPDLWDRGSMYVCMVIRVCINRVRLPILLVVSWTGKMNIPLSPYAPENLVLRDGFSRPVPRQPTHSPYSGWILCTNNLIVLHLLGMRKNHSSRDDTEIRTHVPASEGFEVTNWTTGVSGLRTNERNNNINSNKCTTFYHAACNGTIIKFVVPLHTHTIAQVSSYVSHGYYWYHWC